MKITLNIKESNKEQVSSFLSLVLNKLNNNGLTFNVVKPDDNRKTLALSSMSNSDADKIIAAFILLCYDLVYVMWGVSPVQIAPIQNWEEVWNRIKYIDFHDISFACD